MNDEIIVITPETAPGSGGVADYTLRVVEQWAGRFQTRLLVPKNGKALREQLPTRGGKVLLQYSAYGYHHYGYPRWLLRALAAWKREANGVLVIMFHEIWTFWPVLNKNYPIQQLHRRSLRTLLACADAAFTSTASQAEHLRRLSPTSHVQLLPVGSGIRRMEAAATERESGLIVLFGLQGSRIRALAAARQDLRALAERRILSRMATVGGGNTTAGNARENELLSAMQFARGFEQLGSAPEVEISRWLSRAEFALSAQDELSATKSSTLMAYAAHGVSLLSMHAAASEPLCWATTPAELLAGMSAGALRERAEALQSWQERTCSWPRIAEQFARALGAA